MLTRSSLAALLVLAGSAAQAASPLFDIRYESEAPGMQASTATFAFGGTETFNSVPLGRNQSFTTDFGTGGAISGVYQNVQVNNADQYGGAGGAGRYPVAFQSSGYSIDLSSTVGKINYFGYWLSALDAGNTATFYNGDYAVFVFHPQDVIDEVKRHPDWRQYYGNPNANYAGRNSAEPYIYLNFFLNRGGFDRIVFAEQPARGGYESDNHTVGHFLTKGTGTAVPLSVSETVGDVPEPASWALLLAGFGLVGATTRRRRLPSVAC